MWATGLPEASGVGSRAQDLYRGSTSDPAWILGGNTAGYLAAMTRRDHVTKNRAAWNADSDHYQELHSQQLDHVERAWGVWALLEDQLDLLGDVSGRGVL